MTSQAVIRTGNIIERFYNNRQWVGITATSAGQGASGNTTRS